MTDFSGSPHQEHSLLAHLWLLATTKPRVVGLFALGVLLVVFSFTLLWKGIKRYRNFLSFYGLMAAYAKERLRPPAVATTAPAATQHQRHDGGGRLRVHMGDRQGF